MNREDFMDIVYSELESDHDNNRANRIIEAADEYAERRVDDALQVMEELQSVQPEIIRCKDCKHLFNKDDEGGKCWHFNGFSKVVSYDDFCSFAERRTDG